MTDILKVKKRVRVEIVDGLRRVIVDYIIEGLDDGRAWKSYNGAQRALRNHRSKAA